MAERGGPQVYSIAAHRGFADALVAGVIPRYAEPELGLARLTLLLPSRRAERIVTEAFVRLSGSGLLLPRMAVVGDLDLDETLGPLLDPLGAGASIPPAADPARRLFRLAELLRAAMPKPPPTPALLRLAFETGRTMDRLAIEGLGFDNLVEERIAGIVGDQARHWIDSTRIFATVLAQWQAELATRGEVDPPERRNRLFDHAARRWRETPPPTPLVAAGITSASPALAHLLRVVAETPRGAVILPDLDLSLDDETWDLLGTAGPPPGPGDPPFDRHDALTHPQYHLKLLLNRMGVNRGEVDKWHRAGLGAAPPERSRAISNLFLPSAASARWVDLPAAQRRLSGVRLMNTAHPGEEAQAIAILIREALDVPERRVALVTPDRGLAGRVVAHLRRWDILADDSAGVPLPQTAAGRVLLQLAEVVASAAAPVALLALLENPLVRPGESRPAWLDYARGLDLKLRGPRPLPGLPPLRAAAAKLGAGAADWWGEVEAIVAPLLDWAEQLPLSDALDRLVSAAETLCGEALWSKADGRALAALVEELREAAGQVGTTIAPGDLATVLRDAMDRVAVRPPWGGHPRVAIYGLLEARMSRADLVICGGLTEGTWPGSPGAEPLLPPAVLRALGVPSGEFRIGLAAHDLAGALGAPDVVLSWAARDASGPVIPSRFVLRVEALLGTGRSTADLAAAHRETATPALARRIDAAIAAPPYPRPMPRPSPEQRDVALAVTAIDRLRGDPYQFYASAILRLRRLDPLDAVPSPAWQGTLIHDVFKRWHLSGEQPGELHALAADELAKMQAHPMVRTLWWPRLEKGLEWVVQRVGEAKGEGRRVLQPEIDGVMTLAGVKVYGRADRIDAAADGSLVIVDYKTGAAPSGTQVEKGYALQLGTLGLIAAASGFAGIAGKPERFEYWSLAKNDKSETGFGKCSEPIREGARRSGIPRAEFLARTEAFVRDAIALWIKGDAPFEAQQNPDYIGFNDFDQLMRLDEWQARGEDGA
ncbi:MAG: PD-(D/E)XK nuclease family protein [Novosphingobium sp.]